VILLFLLNIVPTLQAYNPISLASNNMALLTNKMTASDFKWPIIICFATIASYLISAVVLFNKKRL